MFIVNILRMTWLSKTLNSLLITIITLHELSEALPSSMLASLSVPVFSDEINEIFLDTPFHSNQSLDNEFLREFEKQRNTIIKAEELLSSGGHLELTPKELLANQIFMLHKLHELSKGLEKPEILSAAQHFFLVKDLIERSSVFKIVQKMPKGGNLHAHSSAAVSSKWVIANLTYMPGMLRCINQDGVNIFTFRRKPEKHKCATNYLVVAEERAKAANLIDFDKHLEHQINMNTGHPEVEHNTIEKVWMKFEHMFDTIGDVLVYLPAYRAYNWRMLEELYDDNIMYAEIRMRFKALYGDNGTSTSTQQAIEELVNIVERFKETHKDFMGIKVIYATHRNQTKNEIRTEFEIFKTWHDLFPHFIIGFDLVGQEDKGNSIHTFVEVLQDMPATAHFFFHAGETSWHHSATDWNLLDAILLNTTRIGHGYAMLKHPFLRKAIQERGIGLEVSPISNQVLNLVWDLRNHPGGYFLAENIPMVIANDDPGFWDAKGLSYDMYYAIMSFAPNNAGLKTLKHLVWSSIKYSALNQLEKKVAYNQLSEKWNNFLDSLIAGKIV